MDDFFQNNTYLLYNMSLQNRINEFYSNFKDSLSF